MKLRATALAGMLVASVFAAGPTLTTPPVAEASTSTPLMQTSRLTPQQMAAWFHARTKTTYRASVPVEFLAAYFIVEGNAEGVAGDLGFAQAVLETGWFGFSGSQVKPSYNNFGGIGACDGGTCTVARFRSARIGVRAQIQHLRAYGDPTVTKDNLAFPLESPRFHLVSPKGRAPTWEDMGNGNWATDPNYSSKILNIYADMRAYARANPHLKDSWLFSDVRVGSAHEDAIISIAIDDITRGCGGGRYCPDRSVTREEMATFLTRALGLPSSSSHRFRDVPEGSTHARGINALSASGITRGCNPPTNDRFCPTEPVTRAEMAAFLTRALDLQAPGSSPFLDVRSGSTFDRSISAIAHAGVTRGCNPPTNDRFCPDRPVSRAEMATFLRRATS